MNLKLSALFTLIIAIFLISFGTSVSAQSNTDKIEIPQNSIAAKNMG